MGFRRSNFGYVNRLSPSAAAVCDRGGEVVPHSVLRKEMRWAGKSLVWTGFLCCPQHLDPPHPQDYVLTLPPDPVPIENPRPLLGLPDPTPGTALTDDFGILLTTDAGVVLQ